MMKRWRVENHRLEDLEEDMFFHMIDSGFVHIANVLYEEILENRRLIKGYGEDNFED